MLNRSIAELGLNPVLGKVVIALAFLGISWYLFYKTVYAEWIYPFVGLFYLFRLSERERNDFLKLTYPGRQYTTIRMIENFLLISPFVFFLLYEGSLNIAVALFLVSGMLALIHIGGIGHFTLPTPFSRRPFEFPGGFRKTYVLTMLAYLLAGIGIAVGNFNLGVFAMVLVFLNCMYFYYYPERLYYVWIFSSNPQQFLFRKVKTAVGYSTLLSLPIAAGLGLFFNDKLMIVLAFLLLGYLYLMTIILAKYSAFPGRMSLPQELLIAFGIWFPPLLLGVIPFFYIQAVKRLKEVLA